MLRIAICDDDVNFINKINGLMDTWESKPINTFIEVFENGDELVNAQEKGPFDIILLDIVMPLLNGIETAREIREKDKNVKIVFLTSSPEFAVESYTVKANNYLLKPIDETALYVCLDELVAELALKSQFITVKGIRNVQKIPLESIEYVEAQNKHTIFALQDGKTIETTEPMHIHELKLTLDDGFYKCHRSYIVNISHINKFTSKEITMRSGQCIPISRSCQKEFETAYFSVIFGRAGGDK